MTDLLLLTFLFLFAGVVAVPIASRLGLGSVLGYLIAGIGLSPLLARAGVDVASIQHYAEFGVVMMLFLVGLELEPRRLWELRNRLLGLGGLQVLVTMGAITAAGLVLDWPFRVALAVGAIFSLSSTAIVLQTLGEKGLLRSDGGQGAFSILLFQDIAVIPMLALIPLLALPELAFALAQAAATAAAHAGDGGHGAPLSLVEGRPGWQQAGITLAAIAAVIFGGSTLTRPLFRFIAMARLRELFTAAALMLVVAIALLMNLVGLSAALGTFLAGVVLANSEYRHELESDIDPFRGLLLGLFFITVGAGMDFQLLAANAGQILGLALAAMAIKGLVLYGLAALFGIRGADRWLAALGLSQMGEFGFVLLAFAVGAAVLPAELADRLLLVVAVSMLLTPLLFIVYDRLIAPIYSRGQERAADAIERADPIIIAGHGRFGGIVNRMLRGAGFEPVVLDYGSENLEMLRAFGFEVYFGDATRPDLLHAAGIENARLLVIAIDDRAQTTALCHYMATHHPSVHVIARARDRQHVYDLWAAGCRDIIRESFDSGVRTGRSAYEALGIHPFEAQRLARSFVRSDLQALRELVEVYDPDVPSHENPAYVAKSLEARARMEAEMKGEDRLQRQRGDRGWVPPSAEDVEAVKREAGSQ